MMSALFIVGLGVLALGFVVLLVFPNRPGGAIQLPGGTSVNSAGAGLPVIVLGVFVMLFSATHGAVSGGPPQTGGAAPAASAGSAFPDASTVAPSQRPTVAPVQPKVLTTAPVSARADGLIKDYGTLEGTCLQASGSGWQIGTRTRLRATSPGLLRTASKATRWNRPDERSA
jgi:hypothetical protein